MNTVAADPLLRISNLGISIGSRQLVTGLDVTVAAGELWCVLGANGIGKTMLLRALAGLRTVDSGSIHLAGRLLQHWSPLEAARLRAFMPQTTHDPFALPVLDAVLRGRHPHLTRWAWADEAARSLAHEALRAVAADDLAARDITTLSGGERQRVAIAAALVQDAPLLLLDEPIAHLDLHHQVLVLTELRARALAHQQASVLAIHDLNLAHRFATHAMLFGADGRISVGPIEGVMDPARLSEAFGHPVLQLRLDERVVFVAE